MLAVIQKQMDFKPSDYVTFFFILKKIFWIKYGPKKMQFADLTNIFMEFKNLLDIKMQITSRFI